MRLIDPFSPPVRRSRPERVYGRAIPEPRITWIGLALALIWLGLPVLMGLLIFDVVVWALGELAFGACVALWCIV